jgi:thioredoxin reductase (NADPH)
MSNMTHDVIIIGSGPAGLTAGIYTARAGFRTLIKEGPLPGGQLMLTTNVENWPGQKSILGPDLMMGVREHAQQSGCEFLSGSVMRVNFSSREHELYCENNKKLECKSVIIATGSSPKKLLCPGENVYWGKGVSVCATCDAPFYKDKDVIVVGGGNSAVTEAEHLSRFARRVTIVHIGDKLRRLI